MFNVPYIAGWEVHITRESIIKKDIAVRENIKLN